MSTTQKVESTTQNVEELIIQNLATIEQAMTYLTEQMEPVFFKAVNSEVEDWKKRHGWVGGSEYDKEKQDIHIWVRPKVWGGDEKEEEGIARFVLYSVGEKDDWSWVTTFCGEGLDKAAFYTEFDWKGAGLNIKDWRALAGQHQKDNAKALKEADLIFDEKKGSWRKGVQINATALAQAFKDDDFTAALKPLRDALETLSASAKHFDLLVAKLKKNGSGKRKKG